MTRRPSLETKSPERSFKDVVAQADIEGLSNEPRNYPQIMFTASLTLRNAMIAAAM